MIVNALVPELPVTDLGKTRDFCENILGARLHAEYPGFLIYFIEEAEVHFWLCEDSSLPENSSVYLRVNDIDTLYRRYEGSPYVVIPLQMRPWGIREFYLKDPNGILYKFGEVIPS